MSTQVKILGWLYIVFAVLGILSATIVFVATLGGGLISGDEVAIQVTSIIATCVGGFLFFTSIPGIIAGIGLLRFKEWARILTLILGVLSLFAIPIGTALGIYTLIVLMNEETAAMFRSEVLSVA